MTTVNFIFLSDSSALAVSYQACNACLDAAYADLKISNLAVINLKKLTLTHNQILA